MTHQQFTSELLAWFTKNGRELPWRTTRDPYKIWISEMMLQQTQVDRVIDYYHRFLKKFPDVKKLSRATWPQVLSLWRGLGYYRRARNILRAAKVITEKYQGIFPKTIEVLEELPGIGPYTARAIAVFAYEQDVLVLDTNTSRVLSRVFGITGKNLLKEVAEHASDFVPKKKSWAFHQGMMDFGSSVCTAKNPTCLICPMREFCSYPKRQLSARPLRAQAGADNGLRSAASLRRFETSSCKEIIQVAAAIIHKKGNILITRRPEGKHLEGYWEFPGGKRQGKESWRDCVKREIKEELGIEVAVRPHDWTTDYTYEDRMVHIRFHRCSILKGKPKMLEGQAMKWVKPEELAHFSFPPANKEVIAKLVKARFVDPQT